MRENEESNTNGVFERYKNINPHLQHMAEDTLYHIGLTSGKEDLKKMFGDVKVSKSMAVKGKDSKRNRVFLLNITHTRGRDLEYQCFYLQAEKE